MRILTQQLDIDAPPGVVHPMLVDPDRFVTWMAAEATLDPTPGGELRWTHADGDRCAGSDVELVPHRRVVCTYGWERAEVGIPPGSTTVEIDLEPVAGGTRLTLVHRGLDAAGAEAHAGGWAHYLHRLGLAAAGRSPGPDPFADRRVPTREERARRAHR